MVRAKYSLSTFGWEQLSLVIGALSGWPRAPKDYAKDITLTRKLKRTFLTRAHVRRNASTLNVRTLLIALIKKQLVCFFALQ